MNKAHSLHTIDSKLFEPEEIWYDRLGNKVCIICVIDSNWKSGNRYIWYKLNDENEIYIKEFTEFQRLCSHISVFNKTDKETICN